MRLDADMTASEEAVCRTFQVQHTDILLRNAGAIARALNAKRVEQGRDWLAQKFTSVEHPDGFFLRVTSHMAQWIVPMWQDDGPFDRAQVSYLRSMTPLEHATAAK